MCRKRCIVPTHPFLSKKSLSGWEITSISLILREDEEERELRTVFGCATKAWVVDDSRARDVRTFAMVMMSVKKWKSESWKLNARFGDGDGGMGEGRSSLEEKSELIHFSDKLKVKLVLEWLLFMIYRWRVLMACWLAVRAEIKWLLLFICSLLLS